jgi:hypothetical protein
MNRNVRLFLIVVAIALIVLIAAPLAYRAGFLVGEN